MPESPFPDPNRTLDDYQSDVSAFGTWKANWWRVRYRLSLELAIWRLWAISRMLSSMATSPIATKNLQSATILSMKAIEMNGKPLLMPEYLDEMRRREGKADA